MRAVRVAAALAGLAGLVCVTDGKAARGVEAGQDRIVISNAADRAQSDDQTSAPAKPLPTAAQAAPAPLTGPSPALALAALDRRVADLDAEEEASKRELADVASRIAKTRRHAWTKSRAYYKLTRAGMLPVGAGFGSLVDHAMRVERAHRGLVRSLGDEQRLRERGAEIASNLERIERDRGQLARQRTAMDAARIAMADEARRQEAFDQAFASSTGASNDFVAVRGAGDRDGVGSAFAQARGKLLFPVTARAEVRRAHQEGMEGPGLEIRTAAGAAVRAVFAGRVAFSDRYGAYGRLVIVDHGDHYYSVSGNLAGVDVKVGDEVTAGERLGTVGDEGKGPLLYFEVRHGTDTIAAEPWLGVSATR